MRGAVCRLRSSRTNLPSCTPAPAAHYLPTLQRGGLREIHKKISRGMYASRTRAVRASHAGITRHLTHIPRTSHESRTISQIDVRRSPCAWDLGIWMRVGFRRVCACVAIVSRNSLCLLPRSATTSTSSTFRIKSDTSHRLDKPTTQNTQLRIHRSSHSLLFLRHCLRLG